MDRPKEEYYTNMLEKILNYNDRNNRTLSNEKLQQAISKVMAVIEEDEIDAKCNANHVTMDTISNISISLPSFYLTPIVLKNHSTILPS